MPESTNTPLTSKNEHVIKHEDHHIPGLGDFTHQNLTSSVSADPFHHHPETIEIHCMVRGERIVYLDGDEGLTRHIIYGNEAFITFPYELHQNGDSSQSPCEFYAFQIDLRARDNLLCLNKEFSNDLSNVLLGLKHRHLSLSSSEFSLLRRAYNLFTSNEINDQKTALLTLCTFLFNLQYMLPAKHGIRVTADPNIDRVLSYISQNVSGPIPLNELAQISSYSLSRFKTKFKNEIGIPPAEYITLQRIKHAKKLLETTNMSITDLAYELGFSSSNYFSSVFKKILNTTPQQYKKTFMSNQFISR